MPKLNIPNMESVLFSLENTETENKVELVTFSPWSVIMKESWYLIQGHINKGHLWTQVWKGMPHS